MIGDIFRTLYKQLIMLVCATYLIDDNLWALDGWRY